MKTLVAFNHDSATNKGDIFEDILPISINNGYGLGAIKFQNTSFNKHVFLDTVSNELLTNGDIDLYYAITTTNERPPDADFVVLSTNTTFLSTITISKHIKPSMYIILWIKAISRDNPLINMAQIKIQYSYYVTPFNLDNTLVYLFKEQPGSTTSQDIMGNHQLTVNGGTLYKGGVDILSSPVVLPADSISDITLSGNAAFSLTFYTKKDQSKRTLANINLEDKSSHTHSTKIYIDTDNKIVIEVDNGTDISPIYKSIDVFDDTNNFHTLTFYYNDGGPWWESPVVIMDRVPMNMDVFFGTSFTDSEAIQLRGDYRITSAIFGATDESGTEILNGAIGELLLYVDNLITIPDIIRSHLELANVS